MLHKRWGGSGCWAGELEDHRRGWGPLASWGALGAADGCVCWGEEMPSLAEDLLAVTNGILLGPASSIQPLGWNLTELRASHLSGDDRNVPWESQVRVREQMSHRE